MFQRELILPALMAVRAKLSTPFLIAHANDCRGQCIRIAGRGQQSGFAFDDDVADARSRDGTRNDRQARPHRFEQHESKRFATIE